jgi:hypothetical protein
LQNWSINQCNKWWWSLSRTARLGFMAGYHYRYSTTQNNVLVN